MNKPPEKIRVVIDKDFYTYTTNKAVNELNSKLQCLAPFTEHFYTLEKPMTQKTENLTEKDERYHYDIDDIVEFDQGEGRYKGQIYGRNYMYDSVVSYKVTVGLADYLIHPLHIIVPDPSKPKEVEKSEYEKDKSNLAMKLADSPAWFLLNYLEKHFQRKP